MMYCLPATPPCIDTFSVSTNTLQYGVAFEQAGVESYEACKEQCLINDECYSFNWNRAAGPNVLSLTIR